MKKIYFTGLFAVLSFIGFSQSVNLTPISDNSVYQDQPFNSAGVGRLYAGLTNTGFRRRALMKFDLSSIPAGSTILTAELTVNVEQYGGTVTSFYSLHELTAAFGEGTSNPGLPGGLGAPAVAPDATWNDAMFGTAAWGSLGGDFVLSPLTFSSMSAGLGNQVFATGAPFVTAVQGWFDTPATNFGVIMVGDEGTNQTARRFGSKEGGIAPVLVVTYSAPPCVTPPTAICQNVTTYINAAGNATITGADLDGGSIDNCGTAGLTFTASQTAFTCGDISSGAGAGLMITGAYDGPLSGGTPKGVELYAPAAIADLSNYGIGSANNGGGTDGEEFTFPAVAVPAGTFIYVSSDSTGFNNFFGFNSDYVTGAMSINGDDAVELFQGGSVIDVFGDINVDGTGQPWDHLDGWAYRNDLEVANGGVFNSANWFYSGTDALDGETTNATAVTPIPNGTFTALVAGGISVTMYATDGSSNVDSCVAQVVVLDSLAPLADNATLSDVTAQCEITTLIAQTATDNCDGVIVGTNDAVLPITVQGTTVVTWSYVDSYGNTTTQLQNVVLLDLTDPGPDVAVLGDLTDDCEVAAPVVFPTATDNCAGSLTGVPDVVFPITTIGTTTITWMYDDGNGNTFSQIQTVFINGLDNSVTAAGGTLTANASGLTYQWIDCFDDSFVVGETNQAFSPSVTGDYAVIITDGSCSDTSACTNVIFNGLKETGIDLGITIAPNPSVGDFTVSFDHAIDGTVYIYDFKGVLIQLIQVDQSNKVIVQLSDFEAGIYLMKTQTSSGIETARLMKH
ncbi:MAG: hypothetical protein ACI865_001623 [Flavobacteriaceae bacterium]|jgi:hypothetical protein